MSRSLRSSRTRLILAVLWLLTQQAQVWAVVPFMVDGSVSEPERIENPRHHCLDMGTPGTAPSPASDNAPPHNAHGGCCCDGDCADGHCGCSMGPMALLPIPEPASLKTGIRYDRVSLPRVTNDASFPVKPPPIS